METGSLIEKLEKLAAHLRDLDSGSGVAALLSEAAEALRGREVPVYQDSKTGERFIGRAALDQAAGNRATLEQPVECGCEWFAYSDGTPYQRHRCKAVDTRPDHRTVTIPVGEDEAVLMVLLGTDWLEKNAPHRLREREAVTQAEIDLANLKKVFEALMSVPDDVTMAEVRETMEGAVGEVDENRRRG